MRPASAARRQPRWP